MIVYGTTLLHGRFHIAMTEFDHLRFYGGEVRRHPGEQAREESHTKRLVAKFFL